MFHELRDGGRMDVTGYGLSGGAVFHARSSWVYCAPLTGFPILVNQAFPKIMILPAVGDVTNCDNRTRSSGNGVSFDWPNSTSAAYSIRSQYPVAFGSGSGAPLRCWDMSIYLHGV